ncbi:MAG TPA: hypothetical protein PLL76_04875 [Thermoanaerobaculia bacterium]|nr:hypothetical protein [Thermoanaerobaculia bacterium]
MKRKTPPPPTEANTLDFKLIAEPLRQLLVAVPNLVEREDHPLLRDEPDFREFLHFQLLGQVWLHRLVSFATATTPHDPQRFPEYVAALFPTLRSQLELLMTLMFVLEKHPERFRHFKKAGWAKALDDLRRNEKEYETDPSMSEFLKGERFFVEIAEAKAALSDDEKAHPEKIPWWPNPGKFKKLAEQPVSGVLGKLDHWLYDELSRAAHFNLLGTLDVGVILQTLKYSHGSEWEVWVARHRSIAGFRSIGLVLATFSEIEMKFQFGTRSKLMFIWEVAAEKIPFIQDLYGLRWRDGLRALP